MYNVYLSNLILTSTHTQPTILAIMSLFQEAAILVGDVVTQPIRKGVVELLTGAKYRIKRNTLIESDIHPTKPEYIVSKEITWKLEPVTVLQSK